MFDIKDWTCVHNRNCKQSRRCLCDYLMRLLVSRYVYIHAWGVLDKTSFGNYKENFSIQGKSFKPFIANVDNVVSIHLRVYASNMYPLVNMNRTFNIITKHERVYFKPLP